jgi:hypothetical protein
MPEINSSAKINTELDALPPSSIGSGSHKLKRRLPRLKIDVVPEGRLLGRNATMRLSKATADPSLRSG